jgi:hypothetical protein
MSTYRAKLDAAIADLAARMAAHYAVKQPADQPAPTLEEQIADLEQRQRYYDAAESGQWTAEREAREANERALLALLYDRS